METKTRDLVLNFEMEDPLQKFRGQWVSFSRRLESLGRAVPTSSFTEEKAVIKVRGSSNS